METLSIKSSKNLSINRIEDLLSRRWRVEKSPEDTLVIHGSNNRAYLYLESPSGKPEQFCIFLDYADVELAKAILAEIANDSALMIDNDFGTVLPGDQFLERCRIDKDWDWRREGR